MSLINQMLKDLAHRSKPQTNPEIILSGLIPPRHSKYKKNKFHYGLIASSVVLILVCFFIIQSVLIHEPQQTVTQSIDHPNPIAKTPAKKIEPQQFVLPIIPVELTGITLQVEKETSNLRLLLNQDTPYRVTGNGSDRLMIVLENTRLIANLPQIDTVNSAIRTLKVTHQADGSLKIILMLNKASTLTHLELNQEGKLPELQIDFAYKGALSEISHEPLQENISEEQPMNSIKRISYDTSVENEYQHAMDYLKQGENDEALVELTQFLEKYPTFTPARTSLATLYIKQGKTSQALQIINAGLQQQPLHLPYIQLKAQILVDNGQIKEALNLLQTAPPPLEENSEYHAFMAALYQRQNNFGLAEKLYEKLVNFQPTNSMWWIGLGIARESLRKNQQALTAYKNANSTDNLSAELKVYVETRIDALA